MLSLREVDTNSSLYFWYVYKRKFILAGLTATFHSVKMVFKVASRCFKNE